MGRTFSTPPSKIEFSINFTKNLNKFQSTPLSMLRSMSSDQQQGTVGSSDPPPAKDKHSKRFSFRNSRSQPQSSHTHDAQPSASTSVASLKPAAHPPPSKKSKTISRKWSSLKQSSSCSSPPKGHNKLGETSFTSLQTQLGSAGAATGVTGDKIGPKQQSQQPTIHKKPKWEVIEHYKGTNNGRDTISSSLLAVSTRQTLVTLHSNPIPFRTQSGKAKKIQFAFRRHFD